MIVHDLEIQQALNELPDHIKETVENFNWSREILAIGQKYGIQIDDVHLLQRETMRVIVGLERAANYKSNLMRSMNIDSDLADELVHESNVRIFEELQRIAFTKEQHEEVAETMKEEGVHLGDEDVEEETTDDTPVAPPMYHEPLDDDDYRGISGHRINTDFLNESGEVEYKDQELEKTLYNTTVRSKGDTLVISEKDTTPDPEDTYLNKLKNT